MKNRRQGGIATQDADYFVPSGINPPNLFNKWKKEKKYPSGKT
jgi:hypothetical protein